MKLEQLAPPLCPAFEAEPAAMATRQGIGYITQKGVAMDTVALLGSLLGLGLSSGVRLYATVLAVGLGIRFGWFHLNPALQHLDFLAQDWILIAAGVAYLLEFLADKIPYVDTAWDTVHTLIRPIGAAMLGAAAVGNFDPPVQAVVAILCGGVALTGHSTKAGTRLMVNASPEPVTNVVVSLTEDALAFVWVWLTVKHPVVMFGIVCVFLLLFIWAAPRAFRMIRNRIRALRNFFASRRPVAQS